MHVQVMEMYADVSIKHNWTRRYIIGQWWLWNASWSRMHKYTKSVLGQLYAKLKTSCQKPSALKNFSPATIKLNVTIF